MESAQSAPAPAWALALRHTTTWLTQDLGGGPRVWKLAWVISWLLISGVAPPHYPLPEGAWFALCITVCVLGDVIMAAADAQKYYTLRERRGLITDGMFRYVRHPNYLGEMMIYGSFALMVWHWLPPLVLAWMWGTIFAVNMVLKEASMSKYPEWAAYKQRSWWLVPFVL